MSGCNLIGGHLLRQDEFDVFRITLSTHFGNIETGDFDRCWDAVAADHLADEPEDDAAGDDVPAEAGQPGDALGDELLCRLRRRTSVRRTRR